MTDSPHSNDQPSHPAKQLVKCKWRKLDTFGDVPPPRSSCAAGVVGNKLIIFSGEQVHRIPVDGHVYVLDLSNNQSKSQPEAQPEAQFDNQPEAESDNQSGAESDNQTDGELVNPPSNEPIHQWYCITERAESWPLPRVGPASAVTSDKLLMYGGRIGKDLGDQSLGDFWQLDIVQVNRIVNFAKQSKGKSNAENAAEATEATDRSIDQSVNHSASIWTPLPIMGTPPPPLSYASMVAGKDTVYVLNGATVSHGLTNDIWYYDFNKQQWDLETFKEMFGTPHAKRPCPSKRTGAAGVHSSAGLHVIFGLDGKELLADHWLWDLEARDWQRYEVEPIVPPARSVSQAVFLPSVGDQGSIFICCGESSASEDSDSSVEFHHDCWIFDVSTKTWHELEMGDNAPSARGWLNACVMQDGRSVVLFGGYDGKQRFNDVYIWSIDN